LEFEGTTKTAAVGGRSMVGLREVGRMRILLHVCCANCAIHPLEALSEEGHQVFGYWYNPNIHPFTEYQRRLDAVKSLEEKKSFPVFYHDSYDLEKYLKVAIQDVENRCSFCYKIRLIKAASFAKERNFDGFTTTLLISPYQKHDLIRQIGEKIGADLGIRFRYSDFRQGFYEAKNEAKELELYSQKYCGCIFSEKERHLNRAEVDKLKRA
jgi:predicted adenine nucleotide alpha hydrolase (AANH) superfamily ATPase